MGGWRKVTREVQRRALMNIPLDIPGALPGYPQTTVIKDVYGANYGHPAIYFTPIVRIVPEDLAVDETGTSKTVGRVCIIRSLGWIDTGKGGAGVYIG